MARGLFFVDKKSIQRFEIKVASPRQFRKIVAPEQLNKSSPNLQISNMDQLIPNIRVLECLGLGLGLWFIALCVHRML